jgi:hypothetical protein
MSRPVFPLFAIAICILLVWLAMRDAPSSSNPMVRMAVNVGLWLLAAVAALTALFWLGIFGWLALG